MGRQDAGKVILVGGEGMNMFIRVIYEIDNYKFINDEDYALIDSLGTGYVDEIGHRLSGRYYKYSDCENCHKPVDFKYISNGLLISEKVMLNNGGWRLNYYNQGQGYACMEKYFNYKGKVHNEGGAAVIYGNGEVLYYLEGKRMGKDEWEKKMMVKLYW